MFTDIVGYTAITARDEQAGRRVRDRHRATVRPLVELYHGQWIEATGDESLSSYPNALDAVNCAFAIQEALRNDPELQVRIGIHLGDVTFEQDGVFGDGVNVASRIRPLAEPGGLCISDAVQRSVRGHRNFEFRPLGEQELRNVDRPVAVFAVTGTASPPSPTSAAGRRGETRTGFRAAVFLGVLMVLALATWMLNRGVTDPALIQSVAVLPLENLSGDPEQEYFADAMTDALIAELGRIGALQVTSRTSIMRYKRVAKSVPEIARELNVEAVIEGSVLLAGDRVRITVQLIHAAADQHLWSESYERELRDILALQNQVARSIAEEIQVELTPQEEQRLATARAVHPEAYSLYLLGRHRLERLGPGDLRAAIELLERSIAVDPGFARPHLELGKAYLNQATESHGWRPPRETLPMAREAALEALELDPDLTSAHATLAAVAAQYDWDWHVAREHLGRIEDVDHAFQEHAWVLSALGRYDESIRITEKWLEAEPLSIDAHASAAWRFWGAGNYDRAVEEARFVLELDASIPDMHELLGWEYLRRGLREDALREFERQAALSDSPMALATLGQAYGEVGRIAEAQEVLRSLEERRRSEYVPGIAMARIYVVLGENDLALEWLERALEERTAAALFLGRGGGFWEDLRSDPRFVELMRHIDYPEAPL